ncbi:BglG family transcription antiterminator [Paenibacillus tuaregi]|uniref:BglG family transcription antiterminator n=1 Tax=Paenibacillus tuaregi TaxID=1816681 RepID=UPI000838C4AA|nr:BglG family transcription antiterminator [Paenibacillus tuaregi]
MNRMTPRQRQILEILLNRQEEVTAGEIAAKIGVSARTVHREMSGVEQLLTDLGLPLEKKSGRGFQVTGSPDQHQAALQELNASALTRYSTEERKWLVLSTLLDETEPIKLFSLAHDLNVAVATISYDLDQLETWISRNNLSLVRRRGYGVEITGTEQAKRQAIGKLISEHLDYSDLFGHTSRSSQNALTRQLQRMAGQSDLLNVENALWAAGENWLEELPESAYTHLLIELSVALTRIKEGKFVLALSSRGSVSPAAAGEAPAAGPEDRSRMAADYILSSSPLSDLIPEEHRQEETLYLYHLFSKAERSSPAQDLTSVDAALMTMVQHLISKMEQRTGIPFVEDRSLREGLLGHMEPALHRIRRGERVRNPLLGQIKRDYEALFESVRLVVDDMNIAVNIPDEEIGFLVMHFGASMERLKQFAGSVRAILVCSSGIGSSKLLATRIKKEMPQIEVLGNVSWYEAARLPEEDYDLIISTVDLPLGADRYIKLTPLLTAEDIERLQDYIQISAPVRKTAQSVEETGFTPLTSGQELSQLKTLSTTLNEIIGLIDQFVIYQLNNPSFGLEMTLSLACAALHKDQVLSDPGQVVKRLIEREQLGSLVIPDTSLALFHTRSASIHRPSFTLFRLMTPLVLEDEHAHTVQQLLIMLGPQHLSKESLEVLSEISALLLKPEMTRLLETGSQDDIQQYMAAELLHFFENKR